MRIKEMMTKNPITVTPETLVLQAQKIMKEKKIRRLPVVDKGKLVGIVTKHDLLEAFPLIKGSASIFDLNYELSQMKVKEVMKKNPIALNPYTPVEDALRIGQEEKIGSFPIVEDGKLVGIATESDIVRFLIRSLGIGEEGSRITIMDLGDSFGELEKILSITRQHEVPLLNMILFPKNRKGNWIMALRLDTKNPKPVIQSLKKEGFNVSWAVASVKEEW